MAEMQSYESNTHTQHNHKKHRLTALSDDIQIFSSAEDFSSDRFQEPWNGVIANCVMLLPIRARQRVKCNNILQL